MGIGPERLSSRLDARLTADVRERAKVHRRYGKKEEKEEDQEKEEKDEDNPFRVPLVPGRHLSGCESPEEYRKTWFYWETAACC